ncbi:thiamine-phosphate kinase [Sediminitomix flava]|uniref:Thiamine-monophosphate kinase n=1 Tax=Sediminitomix flava TaxID=379075 RepID=A0A315Z8V6_SEDFL|nr:thiamine-phosphate kinase [Sediminitomix flava]PWJ39976.1 thiamine-phosphate kinase [Sediminitomix flava]
MANQSESKRTEIAELGEFGLIDRIKKDAKIHHASTLKGIGDDAAVIKGEKELTVISTDMLVEGVHFDLRYAPLKHLGFKAIAVNVSDIAAMNAIPKQVTVSIAFSNRFSVEAIDELYRGINLACEEYNVDLVGGDTTSSNVGLIISITAVGTVEEDKITYRNTAQKGDVICVSGDLGAAYLGLNILEREKQEFLANPNMEPQLDGKNYLIERQLKPSARMDVVYELREKGVVPTAMMDISDGLASELLHICSQSDLGVVIYEDRLPIDRMTVDVATTDFNITPSVCALNGGEDYELLFTVKQEDFAKIENLPDITPIGYTTEASKGRKFVTRGQQVVDITAQGWKHF